MLQKTLQNIKQTYGKYKIFLMAVYMIFKYSKRFCFAPSFNNLYVFFDLTHFRKLGQKYRNILPRFLVEIKTLKFASEINWPLVL